MDDYYRARVTRHAHYLNLDNEAYQLLQRLHGDGGRITRIAHRACARWERRRSVVRSLGMDERSIQALNTGDTVTWRGHVLTIVDWHCHRDPVFGPSGARIWAEPIFQNEQEKPVDIASSFWHELV